MKAASFILFILFFCSGCGERAAKVGSPKSYHSSGLSIRIPGNWKVTDDDQGDGYRTIMVESPGDALAIIQILPVQEGVGLEDYARAFSTAAGDATPLATVSASVYSPLPQAHGFDRLNEKFDITFMGEKVSHQRTFVGKSYESDRVFMLFQLPIEDLAKVEPGFDLILRSFERKLPVPNVDGSPGA